MKTGELMRRKRLERELSLSQVAKDLYIQEKYIQALEEDNYEIIPGETYQRAYFKKYAEYLGLAEMFDRLASSGKYDEIEKDDEDESIFGGEWDSARWLRVITKTGLVVIILAVFISLGVKKCSPNQPTPQEDPRVDSTQQVVQVIPSDEAISGWEIPDTSPLEDGQTEISEDLAYRLQLIAYGQCWVTLKTRDGTLFYGAMEAGDTLEFTDFIGFYLRAGAPEKLIVKLNDNEVEWQERQYEMYLPEGFTLGEEEASPEPEPEPEDPGTNTAGQPEENGNNSPEPSGD